MNIYSALFRHTYHPFEYSITTWQSHSEFCTFQVGRFRLACLTWDYCQASLPTRWEGLGTGRDMPLDDIQASHSASKVQLKPLVSSPSKTDSVKAEGSVRDRIRSSFALFRQLERKASSDALPKRTSTRLSQKEISAHQGVDSKVEASRKKANSDFANACNKAASHEAAPASHHNVEELSDDSSSSETTVDDEAWDAENEPRNEVVEQPHMDSVQSHTSYRDSMFARAKSFFSALSASVSPLATNLTRQPSSTRLSKGFNGISSSPPCEPTDAVTPEQPKEYYPIVESALFSEDDPVPESSNRDIIELLPSQSAEILDHPLPPADLESMEQPTSWMDIDRVDLMDIEKQRNYLAEPATPRHNKPSETTSGEEDITSFFQEVKVEREQYPEQQHQSRDADKKAAARKRVKVKRRHVEVPPPASVVAGEYKFVPEPVVEFSSALRSEPVVGSGSVLPPKLVVGFSSMQPPEPVVGSGSVLSPKPVAGFSSVPSPKPTSPRKDAPLPLPAKPAVPKPSHRKSPAWCSSAHTPVGACAERGPYTSASGSKYYKYYWDCCGSQAKSPKHHSELEGSLRMPKMPPSKSSDNSQSKKVQATPKQAPTRLASAESPVKPHIGQWCRNGGTEVGECKIYGPYAYGGGAPSYRYKWECCGSAAKNPVHHV